MASADRRQRELTGTRLGPYLLQARARVRWHGRCVSRARHAAATPCRRQSALSESRRRRDLARTVRARSPRRSRDQPSAHLHDSRRREFRIGRFSGHGVSRRGDARRGSRERPDRDPAGARRRDANRLGPGCGASRGHRSSRPQTGERDAGRQRREAPRLRSGQGGLGARCPDRRGRCRADFARPGDRDRPVHGA